MATPYWIKYLINKTFSQRFFWARMTRYPVIGSLIDYALFDGDDIFYLPKDNTVTAKTVTGSTIPVNEAVAPPKSVTAPSEVVDHFIRQAGFHWIMDFCICRDSTGCKDYPINLGCLFLGEAAREINPRFGRPVTMEAALDHVQKCRDAGLVHLIGKNKLDTVWLKTGPGERLMTICNCCPCCCLWKILPTVKPEIGNKVHRVPGITVQVTDACVGCGKCARDICFVNAIRLEEEHAIIDQAVCRGCGRCVEICPANAIAITIDDNAYVPQLIERLESEVDVS